MLAPSNALIQLVRIFIFNHRRRSLMYMLISSKTILPTRLLPIHQKQPRHLTLTREKMMAAMVIRAPWEGTAQVRGNAVGIWLVVLAAILALQFDG